MITLKHLIHAQALADQRHFGRTAEFLRMSQPALSRSIKTLEAELGAPIFDRMPDGIEVTLFGKKLLEKAAVILRETDELRREIDILLNLEAAGLSVAMGHFPYDILGPKAIGRLIADHPGLSARLRGGDWREVRDQVAEREVDLGVGEISEVQSDERFEIEPLEKHQLHLYCRADHPLLSGEPVGFDDLLAYPWATSRVPARISAFFGEGENRAGRIDPASGDFVPTVEIENASASRSVVLNSSAIAGALLIQLERDLEDGRLALIPYRADWLRLNHGIIYLKGRMLPPAARLFAEEIRKLDADIGNRERALGEWLPIANKTARVPEAPL
ncbi:MAG: LysR family transcriptional regulator [Gammaproteobacteria bacterium]